MTSTNENSPTENTENSQECRREVMRALVKCANFAAIKHKDQRRKDKGATPYINHPIGVAYILTHEANITDLAIIQAAILHDAVEDTDCTFEEVELHFGSKVMEIVREVSDDKSLPRDVRKQLQIENAANCSKEAKLVKMADKLYNLRDLERNTPRGWTEDRIQAYFVFARKVCDGLRGVNEKLEKALDDVFEKRNVH